MRSCFCLPLVIIGVLIGGCSTPHVHDAAHSPAIILDDSGIVSIDGRTVAISDMVSALRSAGYRKSSEIVILIPVSPDRAAMKRISAELTQKGFTRAVFVTKRTASAAVVNTR